MGAGEFGFSLGLGVEQLLVVLSRSTKKPFLVVFVELDHASCVGSLGW